jgi:hypothetical protein
MPAFDPTAPIRFVKSKGAPAQPEATVKTPDPSVVPWQPPEGSEPLGSDAWKIREALRKVTMQRDALLEQISIKRDLLMRSGWSAEHEVRYQQERRSIAEFFHRWLTTDSEYGLFFEKIIRPILESPKDDKYLTPEWRRLQFDAMFSGSPALELAKSELGVVL